MANIENFFNDAQYKEIIEQSETYNTRLCIERRLRMPFLDPQTGTAQNHSSLHKISRQRMPGQREGQIYTYASARWRKSRRQYLLQRHYHRPIHREELMEDFSNHSMVGDSLPASLAGVVDMDGGGSGSGMGSSGGGGVGKEEMMNQKEWYYDEMDLNDMDTGYDDVDPDSDFDYEEPYSIRKKGAGGSGGAGGGKKSGRGEGSTRKSKAAASERSGSDTPAKKTGTSRRGRKSKLNLDGDRSSSPYSSKKSRHSMQIHDDHSNSSFVANLDSPHTPHMPGHQSNSQNQMITPRPELFGGAMTDSQGPLTPISASNASSHSSTGGGGGGGGAGGGALNDPSAVGPAAPSATAAATTGGAGEKDHSRRGEKGKLAAPSPYCDFCLGDTRENKKTGTAEELVSCSDCGRSGHPSCLQFTANMMVSVKRYRWQCIECKYCSICGTSDNDDQLLFCDDCDRGYHMYCLSPALTSPPEGSWSCKLCLAEFHTPKAKNLAAVPPSSGAPPTTGGPPAPPNTLPPTSSSNNSAITQQLQQPPMIGGPPGHPPPHHPHSGPPGPPPAGGVGMPLPGGPPGPPPHLPPTTTSSQPMPYGPPPQMMGPHPGGGPAMPPHGWSSEQGPLPPQGGPMPPTSATNSNPTNSHQ